jgi:hypothetical protein
MSTSMEEVIKNTCNLHGHQLTLYPGYKELICRGCGATQKEIRGEDKK